MALLTLTREIPALFAMSDSPVLTVPSFFVSRNSVNQVAISALVFSSRI